MLADDVSVDNGQLTPTLKIRRKAVYARYHVQFEALYASAARTITPGARTDEHIRIATGPSTNVGCEGDNFRDADL